MTGLMDSIDWGPAVSHYHFLPEYPLWHKDPRAVGWWWPYSQASQVSATGHSPHLDSASLSPIGKRVSIRIKHMEVKALLNTECCVLSHFSCDLWPHGLYLPGSSVHGILQARTLEWLPCPPPGDLPNPGIEPTSLTSTCVGRWVLYH